MFGDLHFGNAAFRRPPPGPALLYDPIPRRQPWPFEPAYLEVLCNGSGLVREMAAIRRAQGRAVCGPDEIDRLSTLFCGWLALAFWSMLLDWHADPAQRARMVQYVSAAAHLGRLGTMRSTRPRSWLAVAVMPGIRVRAGDISVTLCGRKRLERCRT
jgi:hypothetical protein